MPRPKRQRLVTRPPCMEGFKPFGLPIADLEPVVLFFEEFEAITLLDHDGLNQTEAAARMSVSRPTLTRIYKKARQTIAEALVEGKAIFIEGGNYHTDEHWYRCETCLKLNISHIEITECTWCHSGSIRQISAVALKQQDEAEMEKGGNCICVACDLKIPHEPGIPCRSVHCPQCGRKMMRENSYHHQMYRKKQSAGNQNGKTGKDSPSG